MHARDVWSLFTKQYLEIDASDAPRRVSLAEDVEDSESGREGGRDGWMDGASEREREGEKEVGR